MKNKYYVVSGDLRMCVLASCPEDAAAEALKRVKTEEDESTTIKLDRNYIFVDERGYRDRNGQRCVKMVHGYFDVNTSTNIAAYEVSIADALAQAGYEFDDDGPSDNSEPVG